MSRLFLLALLASLASGWDRPLPGPVRAAAAHERGGLNPYHFFSVRHDRRKLEGQVLEPKGAPVAPTPKAEITDVKEPGFFGRLDAHFLRPLLCFEDDGAPATP